MLVRTDWDRSPKEGREILLLALLRAFWQDSFMRIEVPAFHMAFGFLQKELQKSLDRQGRGSKVTELDMGFNRKTRRCRLLDELLDLFSGYKILSVENHGTGMLIVFSAETGRLVNSALAHEHVLQADENKLLIPLCNQAVGFYKGVINRSGCDE